ncbi:glycosyltransferase family 2 protein [Rhodoplanes sp. TEM]|uniref:Glycosyltransferase family 2 protein n=1 Tax=Rhodoplanes tepidamans TaxID=200616 RepID=A0ABT5JDN4_RHOTP|nr:MULTISPECIES: glycosyltransferase family 2 protein [Rhodoplanes]MDC7787461.1 glycosyltransferase family 2 protein [Rhodoplanes tepidamans]MDC7986370.1 glycosyltransferase family 2 protein [Rhodoplanes sp. TEM]MDQ0358053.1 GT2 family glycosyltransferase [Rhodoplanes tepidamans]
MPSCDVVVVNYNAGAFLKQTVDAVLGTAAVARVVVVDNASADDSLRALRDAGGRLAIVRNGRNLGFAAACNIGIGRTASEFVLLLNPDCRPEPGAIERLIGILADRPGAGMSGPLLLNPDGSEQAGGRRAEPTPGRSLVAALGLARLGGRVPGLTGVGLHHAPLPAGPVEVEAISGACMLVRRDAMRSVGLMDDRYFLHCEDLDWCLRFRRGGFSIVFTPEARVIHQKGVSSRPHPIATEWHKHRGMARFYRKFYRSRYPAPLTALVMAGIWLRFGLVATTRLVRRRS